VDGKMLEAIVRELAIVLLLTELIAKMLAFYWHPHKMMFPLAAALYERHKKTESHGLSMWR